MTAIENAPRSKGKITNQDNSATATVEVGLGEIELAGMVIVCVLLQ